MNIQRLSVSLAVAAAFSFAAAQDLPDSFSVPHATVKTEYKSDTNSIKITFTPTDHIEYKEDGQTKTMAIETVDKVVICRGGKDANGDYHNSSYELKVYESIPAGRALVYTDSDVLANERYVYYVTTYVGEERDWPDMIEVYTSSKPAAIADFSAAASDETGALPVILSGTCPAKSENGTDLPAGSVSAIKFERAPYEFAHTGTFEVIGQIDNPVPGEKFSWNDTSAELHKVYSYKAYAVVGDAQGDADPIKFRTGQDIPVAPENLSAVNSLTELTLSWDPVTAGEEEGYINPDEITYSLYEFRYNQYPDPDKEVLVKRGIKGTSFTLDFSYLEAPEAKRLRLRAVSPAGESEYTEFKTQVVGNPASLPWTETFNRTVNEWGGISYSRAWTLATMLDLGTPVIYCSTYGFYYDDPASDGGRHDFTGRDGSLDGEEVREGMLFGYYDNPAIEKALLEPVDFSDASNPVLSFWLYQVPASIQCANNVDVNVAAGQGEFKSVGKAPVSASANTAGWKQFFFPLDGLAAQECGNILLLCNAGEVRGPIAVDSFEIDDFPGVKTIQAECNADTGECTLTWEDPSTDTQKVIGYQVYINGEPVAADLQSETSHKFTLTADEATVGVQAHYENVVAPMSDLLKVSKSAVGQLTVTEAQQAEYYDLTGARVSTPARGLYIRTVTRPDGTRQTTKHLFP